MKPNHPARPTLRTLLPWALALGLLTALTPAQAARLALVVGNDSYHALRPLQNATRDARDMVAELRAAGFKVPDKWLVLNATQRQMDAALQDFVASLRPEDEVVFFYAGHGVEIDAQAALVPVDLPNPAYRPLDGSLRPLSEIDQAKQQVLNQSITLNRVARDIAQRQVKFSLLVVDACRDNPVLELLREAHRNNPARSSGPAPEAGLIADAAADTQVLLFSASKGQQALDRLGERDPVKNGVFTRVLLKALRTPGLGLRDMLPQVKAEVKQLAAQVRTDGRPHQQEPRSMAAYDAPNFYFRPPTSRPGPTGGLSLEDLQREEGARQEWATWQKRMQSDYDKTAAFGGSPDLQVQAWERFLSAWGQDNPLSEEDEGLRMQATGKLGQARAEVVQAQQAAARQQSEAAAATTATPGQVLKDCAECPELVVVPGGSFEMGSPASEPNRESDEGPVHRVNVGSFALGRYEVTQGQWKAVMGSNPSRFKDCGDNCPVENVSWGEVQEYARKLSQKSGKSYRLPSEAEWEYAARAGTTTPFSTGQTISTAQANFDGNYTYNGSSKGENRQKTIQVGSFAANGFGLYDMHGNVWEWVQDVWHDNYSGAPNDGSAWLSGGEQARRVLRGGSWDVNPRSLRSANRNWYTPDNRIDYLGFRIARTF